MEFDKITVAVGEGTKGQCREWVRSALRILNTNFAGLDIDVREVEIEPFLQHSFLRLRLNETSYLLDGTGVGKHEPYFGPEDNAPSHLQNSKRDMINYYLPQIRLK